MAVVSTCNSGGGATALKSTFESIVAIDARTAKEADSCQEAVDDVAKSIVAFKVEAFTDKETKQVDAHMDNLGEVWSSFSEQSAARAEQQDAILKFHIDDTRHAHAMASAVHEAATAVIIQAMREVDPCAPDQSMEKMETAINATDAACDNIHGKNRKRLAETTDATLSQAKLMFDTARKEQEVSISGHQSILATLQTKCAERVDQEFTVKVNTISTKFRQIGEMSETIRHTNKNANACARETLQTLREGFNAQHQMVMQRLGQKKEHENNEHARKSNDLTRDHQEKSQLQMQEEAKMKTEAESSRLSQEREYTASSNAEDLQLKREAREQKAESARQEREDTTATNKAKREQIAQERLDKTANAKQAREDLSAEKKQARLAAKAKTDAKLGRDAKDQEFVHASQKQKDLFEELDRARDDYRKEMEWALKHGKKITVDTPPRIENGKVLVAVVSWRQ